jgi:hypothetical protein
MCKAADFSALTDLTQRETIMLWAMRAWVIGITEKIPVDDRIEEAFSRIGAPDAAGQLYAFMWILSQSACRMLKVDCVCSPVVSADERALLDVLALTQSDRGFESIVILRSMIRRDRAMAAAESVRQFVRALADAGFILPVRELPTTRHVLAGPDDGSATVHTLH